MLRETLVLGDGVQIELSLQSRTNYRLACTRDGRLLVEYRSGGGYDLIFYCF